MFKIEIITNYLHKYFSILFTLIKKSMLHKRFDFIEEEKEQTKMFTCAKCRQLICKNDEIFMLGRKWHKDCWSCGELCLVLSGRGL
jgi:hypothetical protein